MASTDLKLKSVLISLGFNGSEIKILETLFKLGPSTVNNISRQAQMDRAGTYRIVTKLEEEGFIQKIIGFPSKFKTVPMSDLFLNQIRKKKSEIAVLEQEAKQLIEVQSGIIQLEQQEFIVLIPKAEKAFDEIQREVASVRDSIKIVTTLKNYVTVAQLPWDNLWLPLLKKGVEITQILTEPVSTAKVDAGGYDQYPNYNLLRIRNMDIVLPKIDLVIHDDKKVWIKVAGDSYEKSSWIYSNNPHIVCLAIYCFNKVLQESEKF
jgi:DNA-binding Lrp family transcriptional regulator